MLPPLSSGSRVWVSMDLCGTEIIIAYGFRVKGLGAISARGSPSSCDVEEGDPVFPPTDPSSSRRHPSVSRVVVTVTVRRRPPRSAPAQVLRSLRRAE